MTRTGRCLTVELEEEACPFSHVTETLGEADVCIDGFSVQAHADGAQAYLVPEDAERAHEALKEAGISHEHLPFVAATLTSHPGELAQAMTRLDEASIPVQAAFIVTTPWGPDLQVAFATQKAEAAASLLDQVEPPPQTHA